MVITEKESTLASTRSGRGDGEENPFPLLRIKPWFLILKKIKVGL
jgi:hypothetical protein